MSIKAYDLKSIEGKTIGVYERADENIRRLKVYLESNNINCNLKYYTSEQLVDGKLYVYLDRGDVDILLGNNVMIPLPTVLSPNMTPSLIIL